LVRFFVAQCQTPPANPPVMYYTKHKIRNEIFFLILFSFIILLSQSRHSGRRSCKSVSCTPDG
jgi:hypothetical protein